jgi:hypothetical protein
MLVVVAARPPDHGIRIAVAVIVNRLGSDSALYPLQSPRETLVRAAVGVAISLRDMLGDLIRRVLGQLLLLGSGVAGADGPLHHLLLERVGGAALEFRLTLFALKGLLAASHLLRRKRPLCLGRGATLLAAGHCPLRRDSLPTTLLDAKRLGSRGLLPAEDSLLFLAGEPRQLFRVVHLGHAIELLLVVGLPGRNRRSILRTEGP